MLAHKKTATLKIFLGSMAAMLFGALALFGCGGGGSSTLSSSGFTGVVTPPVVVTTPISAFADAGGGTLTVTTPNALSAGAIVLISGTTNYNGTYTVVSATPTSFVVTAAFVANETTGSWQPGGGVLAGCTSATTGTAGAITLPAMASVPTRVTGVAPLAVFFDATGTTATATAKPFHDLEYRWGFGDAGGSPVSGTTWAHGSKAGASSRNAALGPLSAHVYETPGTYIVTLTVFDGTNTISNSCVQVAVQDPNIVFANTGTVCFSTSGNFAGCPAGATQVTTSNFKTALATYAAPGRRLLFRRTEVFNTGTSGANLTVDGPGVIGAYGTGAAPIVQSTATAPFSTILNISSPLTPGIRDWRLMDLEFDGQSNGALLGITGAGGFDQFTVLRLNVHDTAEAVSLTPDFLNGDNAGAFPGHHIWDQFFLVDSTIQNIVGGSGNVGAYIGASRGGVLGNLGDNTTAAEHVFRFPYLSKGVISNNTLSRAATNGKLVLTVRGAESTNTGQNEYWPALFPSGPSNGQVIISDNKFIGNGSNGLVQIAPTNSLTNIFISQVILERNWYITGSGATSALAIQAANVTVRNEVIDTSAQGINTNAISVIGTGTASPSADQVTVLNNTFYSSATGANYRSISFKTGTTNMAAKNNLAYAPNQTLAAVIEDLSSGAALATNSSNAQLTIDPQLTNIGSFSPANAKPLGGSYAIGAGTVVPVWSDFFGVSESTPRDLGAVAH